MQDRFCVLEDTATCWSLYLIFSSADFLTELGVLLYGAITLLWQRFECFLVLIIVSKLKFLNISILFFCQSYRNEIGFNAINE